MGRGSGGGVRLLVDIVENSALSCGCCGDVDGRDRRRSARLGRRRAVVSDARRCSTCGDRDGGKESLRGTSWR